MKHRMPVAANDSAAAPEIANPMLDLDHALRALAQLLVPAFGVLLLITVVLMWIVTWMLFKFLRTVFRRVRSFFTAPA